MAKSKIEWTDASWNPVVGSSIHSPGCSHCYAMKLAHRIQAMTPASHYAGTTKMVNGHAVWTGVLKQAPEHVLLQPLRWKRPRMIFVNSMSDLFHKSLPDEIIDKVFAVMTLCPQHRLQVLTKRTDRMRAYMSSSGVADRISAQVQRVARLDTNDGILISARLQRALGTVFTDPASAIIDWPLPNVWLGVSVEDQIRADERRDDLETLSEAGWSTFVSYEPALGPVDWQGWEWLSWLISGGESGPEARPSHPGWHRAARDFCQAHGIAYFFKQWGAWLPWEPEHDPCWRSQAGHTEDANLLFPEDWDEAKDWDDGLWAIADGEEQATFQRVGKKRAGRLLDGREWNEMPIA
jgi:protein gp37